MEALGVLAIGYGRAENIGSGNDKRIFTGEHPIRVTRHRQSNGNRSSGNYYIEQHKFVYRCKLDAARR